MNNKDYYEILEISPEEKNLQGEEFKKVCKRQMRKLSLQYHPDKHPNDKFAEEKFKEVSEAYNTLSDDGKRVEYDAQNGEFGGFSNPFNMSNFFEGFGFSFNQGHSTRGKMGESINGNINITLEECYTGTKKKVKYKKKVVCSECHGSKCEKGQEAKVCDRCNGSGYVSFRLNQFTSCNQSCPKCGGTGMLIGHPCKKCNGTGYEYQIVETEIEIPKGSFAGNTICYTGLGHEYIGGANGDLNILINFISNPNFSVKNENGDLMTKLNISVIDALIGTEVSFMGISGKKLTVKIDECSENGKVIVLQGEGLPYYNRNGNANLYCEVCIKMPKSLSEKDRKSITKLKKLECFKQ